MRTTRAPCNPLPSTLERQVRTDLSGLKVEFETRVDAEAPGQRRQAGRISGQAVEVEHVELGVPRQVITDGAGGCRFPPGQGEQVEVIATDEALAQERQLANLPGPRAPAGF